MKHSTRAALSLGLSVALAAFAAPAPGAQAAQEVAAIHAVDDLFVKAYNAGDVDTVVGLYAPDAILQPPGAPGAGGKAAIRAYFAADIPAAAREGARFVLDPHPQGGVFGDLGWSSGTFVVTGRDGRVIERGKYLSLSRKVAGKWLYVRDMWNDDGAAPPAPAGR